MAKHVSDSHLDLDPDGGGGGNLEPKHWKIRYCTPAKEESEIWDGGGGGRRGISLCRTGRGGADGFMYRLKEID
jgi:hypothetical protein